MMSTLLYALVAMIAIIKADFEDCGTATLTVDGNDVTLQLQRKSADEMVRITVSGPPDRYTGVIIGQSAMQDGYAVIGSEKETEYVGYEMELSKVDGVKPGVILDESGEITAVLGEAGGEVILDRPYAVNGTDDDDAYFDLTDLMTCTVTEINIAAATGTDDTGLVFGYHGTNKVTGTFTNSCCDDGSDDSANNIFNGFIILAAFISYLFVN